MQHYCEVITIGDELLIGQVVDTNSAWIGQQLNSIGLEIIQKTAISDSSAHIIQALDAAKTRARIILITGGLGPTRDDLTKKTLVQYFGSGWREDDEVKQHITTIFSKRGLPVLEINMEQARLPDNCETIFNHLGTAPGMWFEVGETIYVSMPGVPFEMQGMMEKYVLPRLEKLAGSRHILHKTMLTVGIGESFLSQKIAHVEDGLPPYVKLAYLPGYNSVRLRLTARGDDKNLLQETLYAATSKIYEAVSEYIAVDEDIPLEVLVGRMLKEQGKTMSTAESCTGGYIAHLITSVPGCSANFWGSVVAYDNSVKTNVLGVQQETLDTHGAVSQQTVEQMASGVRRRLNTDYAVATSGIAGPDGGTEDKPVGTVWIAVCNTQKTVARKFNFTGPRKVVIERTAVMAFEMMRQLILEI